MITNPYFHLGRPIREFQHFYGRRRELLQVFGDVCHGQCVSVVGIRRIGKTSLLFQLLDPSARSAHQLGDEIVCVYLDCGRQDRSPDQIYAEIVRRICVQLGRFQEAELLETPGETLSYYAFEDSLLKVHNSGLRLALLLDEFDQLASNENLNVDFFLGLRALHINYELVYVTASLRPLVELGLCQKVVSSPFSNIFDSVRLGLFSEQEALELIRLAGVFSPETETFLFDLTGGHPLALQHACYYAFERYQETGEELTREDRLVVWQQTLEAMKGHYRRYWEHLDVDQKRVLAAPTYFATQIKKDRRVANLFEDLVTLGLLVACPDGSFNYAGRALAEFVRHEMTDAVAPRAVMANDLLGQTLGQYQIVERLGRGGMADVYKAHQPSLCRDVAIKVMLPRVASDEDFSARFQREARAVARLDHPNIVQIYDFGQQGGIYYMVMKYIPGENLKARLQTAGPMPLEAAARIAGQVGKALHYAHEQGLVHRDIKPANIMLTPAGEAILTDFGIARIIEGTRVTGSGMVGTPAYMAPEQITESAAVDRRADIYAFGVVLYEMVTGRVPFEADTPAAIILKHLREPLSDPRKLRTDLPDPIAQVIQKALAKEPEQRYQTVQEMLDALTLTQTDPVQLLQVLRTSFNDSELRDLCFHLKIDYEDMGGESKGDKARELIAYCERHGRMLELVAVVKRLRPQASL